MTESIKAAMHTFAAGIVTALGFSAASANFVYIFLISMLPIVELRGAIPVAFALGLNPLHAFIVSVLGNLLPVPFILLLITPLCTYLKKTRLFEWFPRIVESRVKRLRDMQASGFSCSLQFRCPVRAHGRGRLLQAFLISASVTRFCQSCAEFSAPG